MVVNLGARRKLPRCEYRSMFQCVGGPIAGVLNKECTDYNLLNKEAQTTLMGLAGSSSGIPAPTLGK